ncbi:VanW family protein [Clostridium botulinum]|nr:VanW family protein [Clostridium botulinum]
MVKSRKNIRKKKFKPMKIALITLSVVLLVTLSGFATYQYNKIKYYNNLIYPGVSIQNIDLSAKTKEEANKIINEKFWNKLLAKKINIKAKGKTYTLKYSDLKPKNNLEIVLKDAEAYGKNLIIFKRYNLIKNKTPKNYYISFQYDEKIIDSLINKIEKDINISPKDASLALNGTGFTVISHKNGEKLDKDKLKKDLISKINNDIFTDITEKVVMETVKPRITEDKLQGIGRLIGSYSSHYGSISSPQRANNIVMATNSINGKILMPGDMFSFNDVVGRRTAEKGYEAAPVIVGEKIENGLGGGVCQVSSTLFNAVANSNLQSVERAHHTKPVHYVPKGMDATVDYGNIDYKFKNNLENPVYIQSYTRNGNVVFNVYSK